MTTLEFNKIKEDYYNEQYRWLKLKVGQRVYESVARGEMEYFEIIIDEINVDERYINGRDLSRNAITPVKISSFHTIKELKAMGIEIKK